MELMQPFPFGLPFSVEEVAESFLELVMDETKNGDALMIYSKGKQYADFSSLA